MNVTHKCDQLLVVINELKAQMQVKEQEIRLLSPQKTKTNDRQSQSQSQPHLSSIEQQNEKIADYELQMSEMIVNNHKLKQEILAYKHRNPNNNNNNADDVNNKNIINASNSGNQLSAEQKALENQDYDSSEVQIMIKRGRMLMEQVLELKNINRSIEVSNQQLTNEVRLLKEKDTNHRTYVTNALHEQQTQNGDKFTNMKHRLESSISELEQEIASLKYVKEHKQEIEHSLLVAKATIEAQAQKFELSIDQMESKYLLDTQKLRIQSEQTILNIRRRARELAEQELDAQSRQLRKHHKLLNQDLEFHSQRTSKLQALNLKLDEKHIRMKRDLSLLTEQNLEQSRQAIQYKHKIFCVFVITIIYPFRIRYIRKLS
jgi:hypothetical protein